jgi:hypothetical protein
LKFPNGIRRLLRRNFKSAALGVGRIMMNKSLRAPRRESSRKRIYGFQRPLECQHERCRNFLSPKQGVADNAPKKRAAVSGGFKVDNREASNRVDRSHSVSKEDSVSHI